MYTYIKSTIESVRPLIDEHMAGLIYPIDSYLEEVMYGSQIYMIISEGMTIGYFALTEQSMNYFFVSKSYQYHAEKVFEDVVATYDVENVTVISSDQLLNRLLVQWDFERSRMACFFTDSKRAVEKPSKLENPTFRVARLEDVSDILKVCGDFFGEEGGGFKTLEERVVAETIFILGNGDAIYGCGIIENGRICSGMSSIGMFANPDYRQMGVARTVLLNLKEYVYNLGLEPISGCWYYNTLSKASLESAGMVPTSMAYRAVLKGKDKPPKRTGNPPGELVD